jgi:hypothetical protein
MNNITATYHSLYYGFPLNITISRKGYDSLDVQFHFSEGYCPNGCRMYEVRDKLENLLQVKTIIEAENNINTNIKFKFPFPLISEMNESMLVGIAATLLTILFKF